MMLVKYKTPILALAEDEHSKASGGTTSVYLAADIDPWLPQWTTATPTEPGWYWWRDESCTEVVELLETVDGLREDIGGGFLNPLTAHGEWAGPITPPFRKS